MNLILRVTKLHQLFQRIYSLWTVLLLHRLVNTTRQAKQFRVVSLGQPSNKRRKLFLSFGNHTVKTDFLLTVDDQQVEVFAQICAKDLLVAEVVDSAAVYAVLECAVQ